MIKTIATLLVLIYFVDAQCPAGSTNVFNGLQTRYCYIYLGATKSYTEAERRCRNLGLPLVTPKTDAGLNDLYILYQGFSNYYFWVNNKKFIVHLR
jgi:hypothetical protein